MRKVLAVWFCITLLVALAGCGSGEEDTVVLTLATTTSTYDSGLLDFLLPTFEAEYGVDVDIISVGTGQAMEIGMRGDADILLVHARDLEDAFVAEGYGTARWDVMYNDFVYLGPAGGPLWTGLPLTEALNGMVDVMTVEQVDFVSRGDNSGTHNKERSLWPVAGIEMPEIESWYLSTGQGMGDALITANEMGAYILSDRSTYLAIRKNLSNLTIVFEEDDTLFNPYGIIPVNPEMFDHVQYDAAMALVEFMISVETQQQIANFGLEEFGQPLFFPNGR